MALWMAGRSGQHASEQFEIHCGPPQVYKFNVPTFGPGVVYDVDVSIRTEQIRFFAESLKTQKLKSYVPLFVMEAEVLPQMQTCGTSLLHVNGMAVVTGALLVKVMLKIRERRQICLRSCNNCVTLCQIICNAIPSLPTYKMPYAGVLCQMGGRGHCGPEG